MLYEYRRYEATPGRLRDVHRRFNDLTLKAWERHGIEPVGFWDALVGESNQLHYLLRWEDMQVRDIRWEAFLADEEWQAGFIESESSGPLVARIHNELWRPTAYSQLR
jgi:hypothetical protein